MCVRPLVPLPPYFNNVGTRPFYIGAHSIQKVCQVDYMGLFCSVLDGCYSFGFYRGKHDIYCCPYADDIKVNRRANEPVRGNYYFSVFYINLCAKSFKAFYMLIYRPDSKITAPGKVTTALLNLPRRAPIK